MRRARDRRRGRTRLGSADAMAEDVELRPASEADLGWISDLARDQPVARSLSTTAADGLAEALAAGELWIALTAGEERVGAVRVATALRTFDAAGFTRECVRRRAYDRHGAWQAGVRFGLLTDD
jgi:hypothetical protein